MVLTAVVLTAVVLTLPLTTMDYVTSRVITTSKWHPSTPLTAKAMTRSVNRERALPVRHIPTLVERQPPSECYRFALTTSGMRHEDLELRVPYEICVELAVAVFFLLRSKQTSFADRKQPVSTVVRVYQFLLKSRCDAKWVRLYVRIRQMEYQATEQS